ncbi:trafficking kinesin-binding protein 1-like isoform X2 [Asterias rubens]|uniref:trafficking kinesin-binding protein 1-like isoform X2 n=1 Tax=Asterias rubens TaxID=7604 RepID=UPI001455969B|nr:trafficking kinesin-binding protein 1-like isoform X2 [Asterias rubens]
MTESKLCNGSRSDSDKSTCGQEFQSTSAPWEGLYETVSEQNGFCVSQNQSFLLAGMPCLEEGFNNNKAVALCGDRVVQMTKTYNDIDAVTRLLEEKEKDLELAAKIGQSLLEQNKQLEKRIDGIEEQLTLATDQNTQLKHDMKLKEQLLRIYTNEVSYSDSEDEASVSYDRSHTIQSKFINVEALQRKVRILEEDNLQLRMETAEMNTKTVSIEEKEAQLVQDAFKQLGEAQGREGVMTEELSRRLEETYQQKEEITNLLAMVVELQQKVKKLSIENEELQHQHRAARDAQLSLTKELQETKDKSDEYFSMLAEARGEAKEIHRRSLPQGNVHVPGYNINPLPVFPADSLAAELVNSVEQELVGGDPTINRRGNKREQNKNIMKTVKNVNRFATSQAPSEYSIDMYDSSRRTSPGGSTMSMAGSNRSGTPMSEQYEGDNESNNSPSGSFNQLGRPGIPGSNDLETALRRLNLRRQNLHAEEKYAEEEKLHLHDGDVGTGGSQTPTCPTPGSIWSTESFAGLPSMGGHAFRSYMPEKLQIVKPMEGSLTLYHWQRLAQPHMASMLDVRPGVMVKGFRELERDPALYSMDDVEDDGQVCERTCVPSKCFVNTCSTYTYTTSTIGLLDNTLLTASNRGPRMSDSYNITTRPIAAKTFSTNMGLAQVLKERDVDNEAEPKVLTKVEAAAINPAGVNAGLNMFGVPSSGPLKSASEAKRETQVKTEEVEPKGMHRISSRIFSRFAVPVRSRNITDALDPETKTRLMEKVKKIRAEKATSERRTRTLQRQPSIPSVRTRDTVMSPVRTPKIPASASAPIGLAPKSGTSCMGLEGAVGGYSPPGAFGAQGGTIHKANATTDPEPKAHRKLFVSDDSGVELGFGGMTPGPPSTVSNAPFLTFTGTVSSNRNIPCADVLGLGLRSSSSTSCGSSFKPQYPSKYENSQGSTGVGLGALISAETVSYSPKQFSNSGSYSVPSYNPGLSSFSSTTNVYSSAKLYGSHGSGAGGPSNYAPQGSHGVGLGALATPETVSSNPKLPSGGGHRSGQSTMSMSSMSSMSSGQHGLALLSSSSQSSSLKPRSSVMPITSFNSSPTPNPHVPDVGLGSILGTSSRPTALPLGNGKRGDETPKEGSGVPQGSTLGPTSPMSVFVGNLSALKGFRKPGPML